MNPFNSGLFTLFICLLAMANVGNCQSNSPWQKKQNKIVSGVYISIGMHKYSLTLGQGFSVYLKNISRKPVVVSGCLKAITYCDSAVITKFETKLRPGQIKAGGNIKFIEGNSQTGVVTPDDCSGTSFYNKKLKKNFVTRIKDLELEDLVVENVATSPVYQNIAKNKMAQ